MNRTARFVFAGSIVTALSLPFGAFGDEDRSLSRDIQQDESKIHHEQGDIQRDQRELKEEMQEGDKPEAKAWSSIH